ncbi:MAG: hypothetical protein K2X01_10460 [Cyanobacteria bacterium]|nr:hypothetical protein [Cyanobacteriota bacterium]
MKIAILCQEEPLYLGPFLQQVIKARPNSIQAVFVAGHRGAGEKTTTAQSSWQSLQTYWLILEPVDFLRTIFLRIRSLLLGSLDPASVAGCAKRFKIPVHHIQNPNSHEFMAVLKALDVDLVLNQSELLLKKEVLSIPRVGFINRHASVLPKYRGRLASFRAHAAFPPEYGVTIHLVDEGVDTGPIILQKTYSAIQPEWSYPKVMEALCHNVHLLFWEAVDLLSQSGFQLTPNEAVDNAYRFPSLAEAKAYRQELKSRRSLKKH